MSLTVPTAGTTGGRAAEVRYEAPDTGNVIAAFGERVKQMGDRLEADRLDLESGRLQLDMTRDLNQLRLKYEQMGDPAAIEQGWAADIAKLKADYATGQTEQGRPRVDPKLADRFGLMFDDLAERHAFAIGANVVALRQSERLATHIAYTAEATAAAATADPATAETIKAQFNERLAELVKRGLYTPDRAATEALNFAQGSDFDRGMWLAQNDPEGLREALDNGLLPDLAPDQTARLEGAYTATVEKRAQADKAAAAEAKAVWKSKLTDGLAIIEKGGRWADEWMLSDPDVQATLPDEVSQARGLQAFQAEGKNIDRLSLADLQALRAEIAAQPVDKAWQAERLTYVDARIAKVQEATGKDPSAFWQGQAPDLLPPLDLSAPETAAKSLAGRIARTDHLVETGHMPTAAYLSEADKAQLTTALSAKTDAETRLQWTQALLSGGGANAAALAASAGASPTVRQAMDLLADGADPATVLPMLRGETKLGLKVASGPAAAQMQALVNEATGGAFAGDPEMLSRISEGALGYLADSIGTVDPEDIKDGYFIDGPARTLGVDAINKAMGAQRDLGGAWTIGGVQPVRGQMVALPRGVSGPQFNKALDIVALQLGGVSALAEHKNEIRGPALMPQPSAPSAPALAAADPYRSLKAASIDPETGALGAGRYPDLGSNPVGFWSDLRVEPAGAHGQDAYVLIRTVLGRDYIVTDQSGREFYFSAKALSQSVVRP